MRHLALVIASAFVFPWVISAKAVDAADAILINFTSTHCAPCRAMKPVLDQLELGGVPVRHVDVSSEPSLARRYGIRQTPTFVVLVAGQEVTRLVGSQSIADLRGALAIDPTGPLFQTNSSIAGVDSIPAPRTRLVPQTRMTMLGGPQPSFETRGVARRGSKSSATSGRDRFDQQFVSSAQSLDAASASEPMPSISVAAAIERAEAATVRLRVHDGRGYGAGTGTIIDTHGDEALVLTCGHLFRDTEGKGKVEVDLFVAGEVRTVLGQVLDYEADDRDIALVTIRPGFSIQPVQLVTASTLPRTGQSVFSFGCDRGDDPSRRDTRITGVDKYNQHLGVSNLEIAGAPIDGRSGGGLFDSQGRLVGVCNAADYKNDVGIYAGPGNIRWQLDRIGLAALYQDGGQQSVAAEVPAPANRVAQLSGPIASNSLGGGNLAGPSAIGTGQEVIVIVRDRGRPKMTSEVMTLNGPSNELMQMIRRQAR